MAKLSSFTVKGINALKPHSSKRLEIPCPAVRGLYLVVQSSGAKSWAFRYRFAGKPAKLTLGKWPIMGITEARAAAGDALQDVEHGRNPAVAKKAAKADQREAQLTERDKLKTLVEQFDKRHLSNLRSGVEVRRMLDIHVVSAWGERNVQEITKRDVIDLLESIAESGLKTTANRIRSYIGKFFNWCVERDVLAISPASGVKAVAREVARDRVLTDNEIRWLWSACTELGYPWGTFAKLSLLTGQRRGEVAGLLYSEIVTDLWQLPALRCKMGERMMCLSR